MTGITVPDGGGSGGTAITDTKTSDNTNDSSKGTGTVDPAKGSQDDKGKGSGNTDWTTGLDETTRELVSKKGWKNPGDALKSYGELEKAYGAKSATAAPADPKEYAFDVPKDVPQGMSYDSKTIDEFRTVAHKAGVSKEGAKALHDWFVGRSFESARSYATEQGSKLSQSVKDSEAAIRSAWGDDKSPTYQRNMALATRAIRMLDPDMGKTLHELGVFAKVDGKTTVTNSKMFMALAKIGQGMFSEDSLYGDPAPAVNPFDAKVEKENPARAQQMVTQLVKQDPEKALQLLEASGRVKESHFAYLARTIKEDIARKRKL